MLKHSLHRAWACCTCVGCKVFEVLVFETVVGITYTTTVSSKKAFKTDYLLIQFQLLAISNVVLVQRLALVSNLEC